MDNPTKTEHELKIWPEPFADVVSGAKKYEVRKADRPFAVGHNVWLREWNPETKDYTGDEIFVKITYLTPAGQWGLPADVCVFQIEVIG